MRTRHRDFFFALAALTAGLLAAPARGDPLPGEILKFRQLPQYGPLFAGGPFFSGHDEASTAFGIFDPAGNLQGWQGRFMADDFADKFSTPVVHLRWWGSYQANQGITVGVDKFLISFESDIPAGPNNPFSRPGVPLLNQIVRKGPLAPGSGTFIETASPIPAPVGTELLFEYNAELNLGKEFRQEPDKVYWLKIVALIDDPARTIVWGWHNRDYTIADPLASTPPAVVPGEHIQGFIGPGQLIPVWHFQDDAVSGVVTALIDPAMPNMPVIDQAQYAPQRYEFPTDGPDGIQDFSKDLAFELYTIPEPGSIALLFGGLGIGLIGLCRTRRAR
jgi:hypothetical protein